MGHEERHGRRSITARGDDDDQRRNEQGMTRSSSSAGKTKKTKSSANSKSSSSSKTSNGSKSKKANTARNSKVPKENKDNGVTSSAPPQEEFLAVTSGGGEDRRQQQQPQQQETMSRGMTHQNPETTATDSAANLRSLLSDRVLEPLKTTWTNLSIYGKIGVVLFYSYLALQFGRSFRWALLYGRVDNGRLRPARVSTARTTIFYVYAALHGIQIWNVGLVVGLDVAYNKMCLNSDDRKCFLTVPKVSEWEDSTWLREREEETSRLKVESAWAIMAFVLAVLEAIEKFAAKRSSSSSTTNNNSGESDNQSLPV